ncbi:hypothetical protein JTE90_010676 [Oedothorax gibbosus]|uniref:Uncharacterized protein n=1 Tax=Oedothorax gibbosus TaxID=931172 RepID=A0AAV6USI9_9ARAC|nr:hypothetical protein JTE90_010676 [Oedothorax gibbosus]
MTSNSSFKNESQYLESFENEINILRVPTNDKRLQTSIDLLPTNYKNPKPPLNPASLQHTLPKKKDGPSFGGRPL